MDKPQTGWHSRGYHPHFDQPRLVQSITFRLADSVPAHVLARWREELSASQRLTLHEQAAILHDRIENYDAGHGECLLGRQDVAAIVQEALFHFDGVRYRLLEWCIMPNHVHVLIEVMATHSLAEVIHSWKSFAAKKINHLLRRRGTLWMPDYYDRFIRNEQHLLTVREYIRSNPVKAGLCRSPEDWRWSSA